MTSQKLAYRDNVGVKLTLGEAAASCHRRGIPATSDQLPRVRHDLAAWARGIGVNEDHVPAIVLAAYEAMVNVVAHAYPHGGGTLDMHAAYRPDRERLEVTVSDRGRWHAPENRRGWGMMLINELAAHASVDSRADGTTVQMSWPLFRSAQ